MLTIEHLSKHFPLNRKQKVHAVDDVSFSIGRNEVVGLVGESGSGKSTLGKLLVGLHDKTAGSVTFDGKKLPSVYRPKDFCHYSSQMQMIFQDPYASLNPRMTVAEIVAEGLRLQKSLGPAEIQQQVQQWIKKVGLHADHLTRYPHEFSGGQRQRIGIARALICQPCFIVCDEPISALDVSVQAQVINLLGELKQELGLTLLFIAHDLSMVRYVSDRIVVMYLGCVVEVGPADEVFFNPKHPYTQLLIAANPIADPKTERSRQHPTTTNEMPSPINLPQGCRFADRCKQATAICSQEAPIPINITTEHQVSCHLYH